MRQGVTNRVRKTGRRAAARAGALGLLLLLPSCIMMDAGSALFANAEEQRPEPIGAAAMAVPDDFYSASLGCEVYGPPRWRAPLKAGPVDEAWPVTEKDVRGWRVNKPSVVWRDGRLELEVSYPENSLHPGRPDFPLGGISFGDYIDVGAGLAGCLSYEVRFQPGFLFAKGGKLPGLWGGHGVAGCVKQTTNGFSTRFMWSTGAEAFVYGYLADRTRRCGEGITAPRGEMQFEPGRWHRLDQEVRLNTPGERDGVLRVWFDRRLVIERRDILYRVKKEVTIDGVFFSSFFGGSSRGNRSPQDQVARFRNFEYREIAP